MRIVLDTDVLIEVMRGRTSIHREALQRARDAGHELRLSSISLHELIYGALASRRPDHHLAMVDAVVEDLVVDAWTPEDALVASRVRWELGRIGAPIGPLDTLIAGYAIRCGASLATGNIRHFARVTALFDGLRLIDWTISDQPLDHVTMTASLRRSQEE